MIAEIVAIADARELAPVEEEIVAVCRDAFAGPPYRRTAADALAFGDTLGRHARRAGFRCRLAREDGRLVGFALGHTSAAGQWWHDQVARAMDGGVEERWLRGAFAVVDLAVAPPAQGRGLGSRLHDALLANLPHRTAVLSAWPGETPAMRLYRRRGWEVLLAEHFFSTDPAPYVIMGLDLAARSVPPNS